MKLSDDSHVISRVTIYRDNSFGPDLEISTRPDDAGVNGAGGQATGTTVQRRCHRKLNQGDHVVERRLQAYVFDMLLQGKSGCTPAQNPTSEHPDWDLPRQVSLPVDGSMLTLRFPARVGIESPNVPVRVNGRKSGSWSGKSPNPLPK